jgi:hypothetical protein
LNFCRPSLKIGDNAQKNDQKKPLAGLSSPTLYWGALFTVWSMIIDAIEQSQH